MSSTPAKMKRKRLLQAKWQDGLCCWCLRPMGDDITWEHIKPKSKGGPVMARRNLVVAHKSCNNERGTKDAQPAFGPYPRNWSGGHTRTKTQRFTFEPAPSGIVANE